MFSRFTYSCGLPLALCLLIAPCAKGRTWTNAAGTGTFEAELVSYEADTGTVVVLMDGVSATLKQSVLSAADIEFLKNQVAVGKPTVAVVAKDDVAAAPQFELPEKIEFLLEDHCWKCHDHGTQKGDVRLDNLAELSLDARLDLLNRAQEQAYFKHMPPSDEKTQPTDGERADILAWMSADLKAHNASKLEDKLQTPQYGNYVEHKALFSGENKHLKGFTPDRRWMISEFIFDAKINRMLDHKPFLTIDGKRETVIGSNKRRVNLTNPFLLPTNTGVRYYANTGLNGGHLLTMITNSKEAADYMVSLTKRNKSYLPAVNAIMAMEDSHNELLASREAFLNQHIERLLKDVFADQHESLLPEFVSVAEPEPESASDGEATKKAPFHSANPGREELVVIFRSMRRLERKGETDARLIERCEREWFNMGDNERKISARIKFLQNYMEEWRVQIDQHKYDERNRAYEFKPRSDEEMAVIRKTLKEQRAKGDRFYDVIRKSMAVWEKQFIEERIQAGPPNRELVEALVSDLFMKVLERSPTADETARYAGLTDSYVENLGNLEAIKKLIQTLLLRSDFAYRQEYGQGEPDEHGRTMLSPRDASYAISYALTDSSPDQELRKAAEEGRLNTREDYEREVKRLLAKRDQYYVVDEAVEALQHTSSFTNLPIRKIRFFRNFSVTRKCFRFSRTTSVSVGTTISPKGAWWARPTCWWNTF